ncbi:MAG TPA: hypothetical protein PLM79_17415 [Syntrophobacteraceae bacterium]|nr:hypothetical protein [Syntrophobacteraceae bacterium]
MTASEKQYPGHYSTNDCFRAALAQLIEDEGHGAQVRLAKAIGRGTKHLNDVIKGRRDAGIKFQESVAAYFKITHEEMIAMGRRFLSEKAGAFPYATEASKYENDEERGEFIYRKVLEEAGLSGNRFFSDRKVSDLLPSEWKGYIVGRSIDDFSLYSRTKEELQRFADLVIKNIPSKRRSRKKKLGLKDQPTE